ncbi:MAG: formylglycine-generating enzyme family protein [Magnetococcales bacterium]|nr:formylglycine-generating enzyme family protein [Magnetococcales bacterium]
MQMRYKILLVLLLMLLLPNLSFFSLFAVTVPNFSFFSTGKQAEVPAKDSVPSVKDANGMEFVRIEPGKFVMGTAFGLDVSADEMPQHEVTISRSFYLGRYEVTQAQWEAVMGSNPSEFSGADHPVENVSWEEVQRFIGKLNDKAGGKRYRLPTEAEWEYAARAGTTTSRYWGEAVDTMERYAWYTENAGKRTRAVGQLQPNGWGLYDMLGNVWEWCQDWYGSKSYADGPVVDPQGPSEGSGRVLRGGSWSNYASFIRSAHRFELNPTYRRRNLGLRLLMEEKP